MGTKVTIELSEAQHAFLSAKVAEGDHGSLEAALSAALDEMAGEAFAAAALDDPAFVEELRRRADDPPEMFEPFDPDEMMRWLDDRAAARKAEKKSTGPA